MGNDGKPDSEYLPALAPPNVMLVIVSGHVPLLRIGNGCEDVQAPTLWMTVGGKHTSGGTAIDGHGVFAVTVRSTVGVLGSSVVTRNMHDFGPHEVGAKWIVTLWHESGLIAAGNGLLISVKSEQLPTNATPLTFRLHVPTLQTETTSWADAPPTETSPNAGEPVTRTWPGGVLPDTMMILVGAFGSLLVIVMSADFRPRLVGCRRM